MFAFRRLLTNFKNTVQKYPKLSAAVTGVVTATALSSQYKQLDPRFSLFSQRFLPGVKINITPSEPIIDLLSQGSLIQKKVQIKEFKATSPLYPDRERSYEGYDLLKTLAALNIKPEKNDLIIFEAKDGFKSYIPIHLISKHRPVLAVRQKAGPAGQDWEIVAHSLNGKTDGGPFYLMWPGNTGKDVVENHWAFGVVRITFGSFQKIFGKIAPSGTEDPVIQAGFRLFAQNCSCCHTFFGQGSANVGTPFEKIPAKHPSPGSIVAYAANPPKYSLMPPQDLTLTELRAIESYARFRTDEGPCSTSP